MRATSRRDLLPVSVISLERPFAATTDWTEGAESSVYGRTILTKCPNGAGSNRRSIDGGSSSAISLHIELREGAGLPTAVRGDGREAHPADGGKAARCALAARRS